MTFINDSMDACNISLLITMFYMQLQLKGFMSRVSRGKAAAALSNFISVPAKGNLRSEHLNNYVFFIGTTSGYIRHGTPGVCPTPHTWGPTVHLGSKLFPASLGSSGQQYPGHPFQARLLTSILNE